MLLKLIMARRDTFPIYSPIYALSSSEAITELLRLESSQENCTWEVQTGSEPDVAFSLVPFFFFFLTRANKSSNTDLKARWKM